MSARAVTKVLGVVLLCAFVTVHAAEPPPSDASLRQLIAVTRLKQQMQDMTQQVDTVMQSAMDDALQGTELSPDQRKILDEMRGRMLALFGEVLGWNDFETLVMDVYRRSLSQREVDGMLAFYETEAGKAVIDKMPLITANTMQAMRGRLATLMPRVKEIQEETLAKLKATR